MCVDLTEYYILTYDYLTVHCTASNSMYRQAEI